MVSISCGLHRGLAASARCRCAARPTLSRSTAVICSARLARVGHLEQPHHERGRSCARSRLPFRRGHAAARPRCARSLATVARPIASTMPATAPAVIITSRRWRRCSSRWRNASKPTPSMPASSLICALDLPSLPGRASAAIGSAGTSDEVAVHVQLIAQRRREAFLALAPRHARGIGFAADDQGKDAVRAAQPLERQDLLVDPVRGGRRRRADHEQAGRALERLAQLGAEVGGAGEFVAVAEYRRGARRNASHRRSAGRPGASGTR